MSEETSQDTRTQMAVEFDYVGRFRILRKIASGGMGTVYLAEQLGAEGFSKTVAIKRIRPDLLNHERALARFIGEAKLVADLIHENILQVYQLQKYQGEYFIVMEYVNGKTVSQLLARLKKDQIPMDPEMAAFIASRVCRALEYAHTKRDRTGHPLDIVHRDVTPSNIIMDWRGVVKLMDFGVAKAVTMEGPDEHKVLMGKWPYMSPEQVRLEGTNPQSDIFALSLVTYEMLTGVMVYRVESRQELLERMFNYRIRNVREMNRNVPEDLADICMKGLQIDPRERYQSAGEMGMALEVYMYHDRYGPTNERLSAYLASIFPEVNRNVIL